MLENYYETFYIQSWAERESGFKPPYETRKVLVDGDEIRGMFKQKSSINVPIGDAQGVSTVGKFACNPSVQLEPGTKLRRLRGEKYIQIVGLDLTTPPNALTQVSTWDAFVIDREDIE